MVTRWSKVCNPRPPASRSAKRLRAAPRMSLYRPIGWPTTSCRASSNVCRIRSPPGTSPTPVWPALSRRITTFRVKNGPCAPERLSNMSSCPATGRTSISTSFGDDGKSMRDWMVIKVLYSNARANIFGLWLRSTSECKRLHEDALVVVQRRIRPRQRLGLWLAVRLAKIRRRRVQVELDHAAADGAALGEDVIQRVGVAVAHGARQGREILVEAAEHFQHRLFVVYENVAPHGRIGRGNAGEIAKAAGGIFQDFRLGDVTQIECGADDVVGDQVRDVAGDSEHQIVMLRRHD